ncbi:hypothetical protein LARV_02614 [Longilinea arvoryzae]|uniref:Uncharacterized protein n=1 Tax=Longilinea arvoryzae TaxID=360412 RepID=A0A0S7BK13_9CHLR|nr:hypothetical protein [Longilinea arvoryzae]GAP14838.1 hypothetical protein LARV_02614 [Longilinea arvoryzae]
MLQGFSRFLDQASEFLATRKGLLPILGMLLIGVNFVFRLAVPGWFQESDFFLHLGLILAILGFLLAQAL